MIGPGEAVTDHLICLRPGVSAADEYERLFTEPAVQRWLRPEPMVPFDRLAVERMARRDRAHWEQHGYGPWAVREREGGEFVGRGGLSWAMVQGEREVELPWAVLPSRQRRGYATAMAQAAIEVARGLGIERVVSLTLPANRSSRRVMEKAGMALIGEIEHVGLPHVLYEMDLRRED